MHIFFVISFILLIFIGNKKPFGISEGLALIEYFYVQRNALPSALCEWFIQHFLYDCIAFTAAMLA